MLVGTHQFSNWCVKSKILGLPAIAFWANVPADLLPLLEHCIHQFICGLLSSVSSAPMPNRWTDDFQSLPFRDGSFESEKITNSGARSQNRMMRMECRRNTSVISNYGLEIRDKKHDHHYQPTDCRMGAGFRRSDGRNCNHRSFDAALHCHCNQWRQLQAERTQAK